MRHFTCDILVASSVMAEGVDLHLNCRHIIHHDLCWNQARWNNGPDVLIGLVLKLRPASFLLKYTSRILVKHRMKDVQGGDG
ncbi:helicase-related protein [Lentimicrobium sp.]|uniref:helicase-related protein n=1 Tax=Lentimicrobium sp. TaxID=2034841 RepID=UPI00345C3893